MPKDTELSGRGFLWFRRRETPSIIPGTAPSAQADVSPSEHDLSMPPPHQIFISYSRADSIFAGRCGWIGTPSRPTGGHYPGLGEQTHTATNDVMDLSMF
jgi:hypothetical protein